ncbi:MAG: hypothetical protein ACLP7Q_17220 [Isosphaeraceae bacterium]
MGLLLRTQDRKPTKNRIARFFGISGGDGPRAGRPRTQRKQRFLGIEEMEGRTMMSNIPVFTSVQVPAYSSTVLPLAPMQQTIADGHYVPGEYWEQSAQANLTAGTLYVVSEDVQAQNQSGSFSSNTPSGVFVDAANGARVAYQDTFSGSTIDPESGLLTNDNTVIFRAPTTGLYTFGVGHIWYGGPNDSYTLTVRPITLDTSDLAPSQNASDAAKLNFQGGGLYAYLDPTNTVLTLSGPTGRGFQLTGQFQETVSPAGLGLSTATITSTGSSITLDSGVGPISLPLASGTNFTVTTLANGYNGLFGEVAAAGIQFPGSSIIQDIFTPVTSQVGLNLGDLGLGAEAPGVEFGIALGDDPAVMANDAPVNPAVPYLYLNVGTGFSASFGKIEAGALAKGASIDIDPADPSVFVDIKGLPVVGNINFGLSEHGYIPFTPEQTPNHWTGNSLYGDVYYGGTLSIAELTENEVPVSISGQTVINFSTTAGPWTSGVAQKVKDLFSGNATLSELETEAYGFNGTAGLSFDGGGAAEISLTLDAATLIVDGPAQAIYFRGGTVNPLEGTPVAFLDQNANGAAQGFTVDGYLNLNGQFDATLYGNFTIDQIGLSGTLDVSNTQITASASLDLGFISGNVSGTVYWYGGYSLSGSVDLNASGDNGIPGAFDVYGDVSGSLNIGLYDSGTAELWGTASITGSAYVAGNYVGSINQSAYFSVQSNVGLNVSSITSQAANDISSSINSLLNTFEQDLQNAEQTVQNGWNWFWSGSWL